MKKIAKTIYSNLCLFYFSFVMQVGFLFRCLYSLIYLFDMSFPISYLIEDFICICYDELLYQVEQSLHKRTYSSLQTHVLTFNFCLLLFCSFLLFKTFNSL